MQHCGLAKKVTLEAMSRGGVYAYNWALANPTKVDCIYADVPVLDLKSWPGGKGKGLGSKEDWELFKKDYGLREEQASQFKNSSLDNAEKIAKLGFPMLHVVGDADDIVPLDENTKPFEERVKNSGGNIMVIHKPGIKHHPQSSANPTPIVDFILRTTGYKANFATIPAPGWKEGTDWWANNDDINKLLEDEKGLDIVFIENSITQGIAGHRTVVTYKAGFTTFDSVYKNYKWECAGIAGDKTQNILWHLQHGNYVTAQPKIVILTIGVNNFPDDSPEEIAQGIHEIVEWIKNNMPAIKIILIGTLPTGLKKEDVFRMKYEKIQSLIKKNGDGKRVVYFPLSTVFIRENGDLNLDYYASDGIHLVEKGYKAWAAAVKPVIKKMVQK